MKADGDWERQVQAALDHAGTCRGVLTDAINEWRARKDDTASRTRVEEYLARAKRRAASLVEILATLSPPSPGA